MRNTIINEIERQAALNPRICIMTGDLGYGVLNSFAASFPDRYFNMGISEQIMTSAAAGMALSGYTVFTYSIGNFNTLRCIEQLRNDVCYHNANVKVISVGSGFTYGQLGMSHHATEDIALLRILPNMRVLVPADPEEALAAVQCAIQTEGPCYIRLAKQGEPILYEKSACWDIASIQQVSDGRDAALLVCGPLLSEGIAAAAELRKRHIEIAVYSVPCIKPLDEKTVLHLASEYPLLVTAEEHQAAGGLGGAVAEVLSSMESPRAKLFRMGLNDTYTCAVGSHKYLLNNYRLDRQGIVGTIQEKLAENRGKVVGK